MEINAKKTALYCRLSKDDEKDGESSSIETQKAMLMQFAKERNLLPAEIYTDDGYSGLNFDRPGFNAMLDDIIAGKIHTVVTKDLSRLGRDHLTVGHYTEIYFPTHNVRYIAINDGVDTSNAQSSDFAALKNVINEFYSRDSSRKIKAAIVARSKDGKYRAKVAPFGYLKDPDDHNHLIPDPETAAYVEKIFELCASGWGNHRIRDYLREQKVGCPSWFQHSRDLQDLSHMFPDEGSRYIWRPDTLRLLIRNRVYVGDCVMCRSTHVFKTKRRKKNNEKDWIVVKNTHEPLVSRELFNRANELVSVRRAAYKETLSGYQSVFAGLLKCHDCGKALSRRNYGSNSFHKIYVCGTYATYGVHKCSQHKIFENDLYNAVLADIKQRSKAALVSKDELIKAIIKSSNKDDMTKQKAQLTRYQSAVKRLKEVETLFDKLYEDSALGRLSQENFDRLTAKYQIEQKELKQLVMDFEATSADLADKRSDAEKCVDMLSKYADISELTFEMLNTLINRIEVHECESMEGVMQQKIDIYYRFAGLIGPCEYDSLTFYRTSHVKNPVKKRKRTEVIQSQK